VGKNAAALLAYCQLFNQLRRLSEQQKWNLQTDAALTQAVKDLQAAITAYVSDPTH
jgi:hypothetical protein